MCMMRSEERIDLLQLLPDFLLNRPHVLILMCCFLPPTGCCSGFSTLNSAHISNVLRSYLSVSPDVIAFFPPTQLLFRRENNLSKSISGLFVLRALCGNI